MPSRAQLTNPALTFKVNAERETRGASALLFYEANYEASRERRVASLGGEPWRDCPLLQARLAGQVAFRVMRQALQVKTDWQAGLVPSRNLGVEFSDPAYGLTQQLALMPALPDKASAELL
jgi:hypothetical protein